MEFTGHWLFITELLLIERKLYVKEPHKCNYITSIEKRIIVKNANFFFVFYEKAFGTCGRKVNYVISQNTIFPKLFYILEISDYRAVSYHVDKSMSKNHTTHIHSCKWHRNGIKKLWSQRPQVPEEYVLFQEAQQERPEEDKANNAKAVSECIEAI